MQLEPKSGKSVFKSNFYCVGCNRERRLSAPARVGSVRFFTHIAITTAFCTLITWPWLGIKGAAFFLIPVGLGFEMIYRLKMRADLICPDCNFDPTLYLVDPAKAARQVEDTWRKKFEEKGIPYPETKKSYRAKQ
jgi:hypothetical protein